MKNLEAQVVKHCASGQWPSILSELAPELTPAIERLGKHTPCPVHGGRDGFRMFNDANETGGGICNTCGSFPDGIALLQWVNGWSFPQCLEMIGEYLGLTGEATIPFSQKSKPPYQASKPRDWTPEREWLSRIWSETIQDDGTIQRYLEERGLSIPVPESLRLHPGLRSTNSDKQREGIYPAMVARFLCGGELTGLHVTYLDPDEPRKASVEIPRKTTKCCDSINGSAIQLFPHQPDAPIILAEGIETALAVHELANGQPVWACSSAALLERVELPGSTRDILVAVDKDANGVGQRAGEGLAERLLKEDRMVRFAVPPIAIPDGAKGVDWLDVLNANKAVTCAE